MGTATSRSAAAALAALVFAGAAGCGGGGSAEPAAARRPSGFALVSAAPAPRDWRAARIGSGAVLFYPPGWRLASGDRGTATATLADARGRLLGYLNLTPREGAESLARWVRFRIAHNTREGDRDVRVEASAPGVRFRTGTGTCVRDRYVTASGAAYIELACLVKGAAASTVIIAAGPPAAWPRVSPLLYRALSAMTT